MEGLWYRWGRQSLEESVEVVRLVPQERVQQLIPQLLEGTVEVARLVPKECAQWTDKQIVEVPIPQISEDSEQIVKDIFVPPNTQEIVAGAHLAPQQS